MHEGDLVSFEGQEGVVLEVRGDIVIVGMFDKDFPGWSRERWPGQCWGFWKGQLEVVERAELVESVHCSINL